LATTRPPMKRCCDNRSDAMIGDRRHRHLGNVCRSPTFPATAPASNSIRHSCLVSSGPRSSNRSVNAVGQRTANGISCLRFVVVRKSKKNATRFPQKTHKTY
jgi:hypothetical protein